MKHLTSPEFWECLNKLPSQIKRLAHKNYRLLKRNPRHPSLAYKKIDLYRSVRVGRQYRALGIEVTEGILWFWIGTHGEYDKIIG